MNIPSWVITVHVYAAELLVLVSFPVAGTVLTREGYWFIHDFLGWLYGTWIIKLIVMELLAYGIVVLLSDPNNETIFLIKPFVAVFAAVIAWFLYSVARREAEG